MEHWQGQYANGQLRRAGKEKKRSGGWGGTLLSLLKENGRIQCPCGSPAVIQSSPAVFIGHIGV